ncbi:MAG: cobalamin biosynthesis protein CobQ [Oscillospiraceae bacterium]|nr:cobalamin biosynthesis protein CobQ [Oscillospiraceae bacterium]
MTGLINYLSGKKIIIVCGHYGAGKTNISVNLSVEIKKQTGLVYTLADLDTVNPYFRSADNTKDLQLHGIDFIVPPFANSNVDIPSVPAGLYSIFAGGGKNAVLDVGGDETGATVLGMFADMIKREAYEMIYVINKYRTQTGEPGPAAGLAAFIEKSSRLKITSLLNNSNIGELTTKREILDSMDYAKKTSDLLNVPLIGTTSMIDADFLIREHDVFKIQNYTKRLF